MMKKRFKLYGGTLLGFCLVLVASGMLTLMALRIVSHVIGYDLITGQAVHGSIDFMNLLRFSAAGGLFGLAFNVPALIVTYPLAFILSQKLKLEIFVPIFVVQFTLIGTGYETIGGNEMEGFTRLFFWSSIPASILTWFAFRKITAWAEKS